MNVQAHIRQSPDGLNALLGPLHKHLERENVIEVCVNRPGEIFVETYDGWARLEDPDLTYGHLRGLVTAIGSYTHQSVSETCPILSGTLPEGERIQIVMPPAVPNGTISLTIRKPSTRVFSFGELLDAGLFAATATEAKGVTEADRTLTELLQTKNWQSFFTTAVQAKKNILISGAPGSGKTTLSKALIPLIPMSERILTIEDAPELVIPHPNHVRMLYSKGDQGQASISARELLESALRMRPDRILLQELRDATAFHYLRSVNTGHGGSITTIHADSTMLAFEQLALLVKESEAGRDLSRNEIRDMLFQMVDIVVQAARKEGRFQVTDVWFDPSVKLKLQSADV